MAGCKTPPQSTADPLRRSQPLLGTFVTITVYESDHARFNDAVSAAFDEFRRVDSMMSLHKTNSELSRLNRHADSEPVEVSPDLFKVIAAAQDIARETGGAFDVSIQPLANLWGFIWKEYRLPTEVELQPALARTGWEFIELNPSRRTVRFLKPGMSIDLGGIAKGYAVDRAIESLRARGVESAMVKAGGDLRVIGAPPGKSHWTVQIEDPEKLGRRTPVPLRDAALSTSGNYENYFEINGRRYSHILNPKTGLPVEGIAACTVIAPTCMESDAWATAFMVLGVEQSLQTFGTRFTIHFSLTTK